MVGVRPYCSFRSWRRTPLPLTRLRRHRHSRSHASSSPLPSSASSAENKKESDFKSSLVTSSLANDSTKQGQERTPTASAARWLDDVVIGMPLCPFAAAARNGTRIVQINTDASQEDIIRQISSEMRGLAAASLDDAATTLCVLPPDTQYDDFVEFMNEVVAPCQDVADALWDEINGGLSKEEEDARADVQVVPFHPRAEFEDSPDACVDYSSRAPVPVVHLLRQADVDAARVTWPLFGGDDTDGQEFLDLPAINSRRLRRVGREKLEEMLATCQRSATVSSEDRIAAHPADVRTEADGEALLVWAAEQGANVDALRVVRTSPTDMGAVASRPLSRGEPLFELPRSLAMSARRLAEQSDVPYAAAVRSAMDACSEEDAEVPLAVALAAELALMRSKTPAPLAPYVRMLPSLALLEMMHVDVADRKVVKTVLADTLLLTDLQARWAWLDHARATAASALSEGNCEATADEIAHAFALVASRAFALDGEGDDQREVLAICPVADMLNHSPLAHDALLTCLDTDEGSYGVRAHCDYDAGEQVYDSFAGAKLLASDTFVRYGFVDLRNGDPEAIRVPTSALRLPESSEAGIALLDYLQLSDVTVSADATSGIGDDAIGAAAALTATDDELAEAGWSGDAKHDNDDASSAALAEDVLASLLSLAPVRARASSRLQATLSSMAAHADLAIERTKDGSSFVVASAHASVRNESCALHGAVRALELRRKRDI